MPTNLDKSTLDNLGNKTDVQKLEKAVSTADTTLASVEKIAGKVENIMSMITKLKEVGGEKKETSLSTSIAPKIEAGVSNALNQKITEIKNSAKVKVNFEDLQNQLNKFLDSQDEKKTIKQIKSELSKLQKLGMTEKLISNFILNNCEVVFE